MFGFEKKLRDQAFKWHGINEDIYVQNGHYNPLLLVLAPLNPTHVVIARHTYRAKLREFWILKAID